MHDTSNNTGGLYRELQIRKQTEIVCPRIAVDYFHFIELFALRE